MPIGLVSDEDFIKELVGSNGSTKPTVDKPPVATPIVVPEVMIENVVPSTRGRKVGDVGVPDSLRQIIGETHLMEGRQAALDLAREFGVSSSSVSAYAKGASSTASYDTPKESIISHINKSRRKAITRASKTLNAALGAITEKKLDYTDAKDLSVIAKNMSAIIKDLEPPTSTFDQAAKQPPQFVIYAPQFRKEESFQVITVTE